MKKSRISKDLALSLARIVLVALLVVFFTASSSNAVCCGPVCDGTFGIGGRCGDCTTTSAYCGYGPCNMFGCNCDGGCRTGRCSHQYGDSAADRFASIDSNGDNLISFTEANNWVTAMGNTAEDAATTNKGFTAMDTNKNKLIEPEEFDSDLAEGVALKSTSFHPMQVPEGYWSEERMRNAKPHPIPEVTIKDIARMKFYPPTGIRGVKTIEGSPDKTAKGQTSNLLAATGDVVSADVKERPYWNSGKLFFTTPEGDMTCTAEFVGSSKVIMTAAHCVVDANTGAQYSNFSFKRAYNNGGGQSVSLNKITFPSSYIGRNYAYDYAFACSSETSGAGWLGFRTQIPYSAFTAIGYSTNYKCGHKMSQVAGDKGTVQGGIVQMENNPMAPGCSGGAWIGDLTIPHVGGNYAIGLNSFYYTDDLTTIYGPLFDTNTYDMLKQLIQTCN